MAYSGQYMQGRWDAGPYDDLQVQTQCRLSGQEKMVSQIHINQAMPIIRRKNAGKAQIVSWCRFGQPGALGAVAQGTTAVVAGLRQAKSS
jgi:hypothetical protein